MELISPLLVMMCIALICGVLLGYAEIKFKKEQNPVVETINQLLPQTQCGQCGYPGCLPYAEAIVSGDAIDKCPPGGEQTIHNLAKLLDRDNLSAGSAAVEVEHTVLISEPECIGCTLCIQACPVDAIIGAAQMTHTVVRELCTGCDLCIEPCPVDCISTLMPPESISVWRWPDPVTST